MSDEELLLKTGIEQMFAPLQRLLDDLIGPAAKDVGLTLSDSVKVWRFKRQRRLLQEVKRLVEKTGKNVAPIPTRLFFPIFEAASIEDDDEIQTRWAALIANEATSIGSVHPSYIDILRQLAPQDAQLLDELCDWCERYKSRKLVSGIFSESQVKMKALVESNRDSLGNLVRLGLVQSEYDIEGPSRSGRIPESLDSWYELSEFAVRFVRACRAPVE